MADFKQAEEEKSFDYKDLLIKALRYWYVLVLGILLGAGYAAYKIRYSIPTYSVNARILLKDEYSSWGQEYFLPGLELVSARNRLVNEIGAIRSFPLMREVVDQLPELWVTYKDIGQIKTTELYKSSPFMVEYDTLANWSIYERTFFIKIVSPTEFVLETSRDGSFTGERLLFDSFFELQGCHIKLSRKDRFIEGVTDEKFFSFKINNLDALAIRYQSGLGINSEEKESSILVVSKSGTLIRKEIDFINKFIEVYIQRGLKSNNLIADNVMGFVDDRINTLLDTLINVEGTLESFQASSNVGRIDLKGERMIPKITKLEHEKLELEFNIEYFNQIIERIEKNDDASGMVVPTFIDKSSVLFTLMQNLINLYTEKMQLRYDVTVTNDNWKRINEQIAISKGILIENLNTVSDKFSAELALLDQEIKFMEYKLESIPGVERKYANIRRGYKLNNDLYTFLLKKKAEASIAKGSTVSNVTVLDWATGYRVRFLGPFPMNLYLMYMGIGFLIASLVVFVIEYFNDRIGDQKDIESLTDIPILSLIGHNSEQSDLIVVLKPKSVVSEAFRSLRTAVSYLVGGKDKFTIMTTSSVSKEGKTFCSINLASAFAILGKKTVILGADMRKPRIFQDFNLKNNVGMSSYLINKANIDEIIQATEFENIYMVSAGPVPPNPSELIGGQRMELLMKGLKDRFDVVIIDTPPLGLVTDAFQLNKYADASLYVIRHNVTVRSQLKFVDELYKEGKMGSMGIIVNDYKQSKFSYSYGYGAGYGYGYGYGYGSTYGDEPVKSKSFLGRFLRS